MSIRSPGNPQTLVDCDSNNDPASCYNLSINSTGRSNHNLTNYARGLVGKMAAFNSIF